MMKTRDPGGSPGPPQPQTPGITALPEGEFRGAQPVLIIVSGDASLWTAQADCVLAADNMFIAAGLFGITSGWSGMVVKDLFAGPEVKKRFEIPDGYDVYAAAFFGYPLGEAKDRELRKEGTVTIL